MLKYRKKLLGVIKVSENNKEKVKAVRAPLTKKQRIIIIVGSIVAALAVCAGIICAVVLGQGESYTIDGVYKMTVEAGDTLTSQYTFDGDKATNEYYDGTDTVVIEYTYSIKKNGDGRVITLKNTETGAELVYNFAEKTESGVASIMINNVWYDKQ